MTLFHYVVVPSPLRLFRLGVGKDAAKVNILNQKQKKTAKKLISAANYSDIDVYTGIPVRFTSS